MKPAMRSSSWVESLLKHPAFWALLVLLGFSLYLATSRIYQVDEAQNIFTARIVASGWERSYFTAVEPWTIWTLSRFANWTSSATSLLDVSRLFMLAVFWGNITLTALNCGVRWNSRTFPWILLGAATLAPLWDYGFEVRHENPALLLLLACLYVMRRKRLQAPAAGLAVGALCALLPLTAFKSLAYFPLLLLFFVVFPPDHLKASRARMALFVALGFLGACLAVVAVLYAGGHLAVATRNLGLASRMTTSRTVRFLPWDTLARLVFPCSLLSGAALSALAGTLLDLRQDWRRNLGWTGTLPEAILLLSAIGALAINPTPFPYNLCLLVPFAFILAIRWLAPLAETTVLGTSSRILAVGILVFAHLLPFAKSTLRHLDMTNGRQVQLVELAEQMTDSRTDRVYDAAGLVSTRQSIGTQWFLHSMVIGGIAEGRLPSVRRMMEEHPPSVIIPNYRFQWLKPPDVDFIRTNYVGLADDFLVLGRVLQGKETTFTCIHPGRYSLRQFRPGSAPESLQVDGTAVRLPAVLTLSEGVHHVVAGRPSDVKVCWIGPNLNEEPQLSPGNAGAFFVNWY